MSGCRALSSFRVGKVPPSWLQSRVLNHLGLPSKSVIVGPAVGEDSAVLRVDSRFVAAKTDPVTGAAKNIGRLVVHVNANDIAASGAEPKWLMLTQLFPPGTSMDVVEDVQRQAHETCLELGVAIVGGHTELTASVTQPVLVGSMMGTLLSQYPIRTSGAVMGDRILLTKGVAIEAMSILCHDRGAELAHIFGSERQAHEAGDRYAAQLSVVRDARVALAAVPEGAVTSMHDPTEGGLAGALHEIADACGKGFAIDLSHVPINDEVRRVAEHFGVQPLELISSGSLVLCVGQQYVAAVMAAFAKSGIVAADIGCIMSEIDGRFVRVRGNVRALRRPEQDALWKCLDRKDLM